MKHPPRGRYSPRAYQGEQIRSLIAGSCEADGPPCDHTPDACDLRELWPYEGETQEQFVARLRAKYNWPAMAREAQNHE